MAAGGGVMRVAAILIAFSLTACGVGKANAEGTYANAIPCWWALESRAKMYRTQGFTDVPDKMEARSELYKNDAMIAGSKISKDQKQVLIDMQSYVGKEVAELEAMTTEEQAEASLKKLNAKADACFDAPLSEN